MAGSPGAAFETLMRTLPVSVEQPVSGSTFPGASGLLPEHPQRTCRSAGCPAQASEQPLPRGTRAAWFSVFPVFCYGFWDRLQGGVTFPVTKFSLDFHSAGTAGFLSALRPLLKFVLLLDPPRLLKSVWLQSQVLRRMKQ